MVAGGERDEIRGQKYAPIWRYHDGAAAVSLPTIAIMSHALLLRLFLSPSYFSVHVALHYLMLYSDNIGITYYLTRRLREFTTDELRDVWGFIW